MERCLACEADTVGTMEGSQTSPCRLKLQEATSGRPLWDAGNGPPRYLNHLCRRKVWQRAVPGNSPARSFAERFD
jgi:hypothetical protein